MSLRVLVVDDTALFRRILSEALADMPGVEVVGTAANGKTALHRIASLSPDLVTLDLEMPEMNGLQVLEEVKRRGTDVGIIVVSGVTKEGGDLTVRALELGAFDLLAKPDGGTADRNREAIKARLGPLLKAYAQRREIHTILHGKPGSPQPLARAPSGPAGHAPTADRTAGSEQGRAPERAAAPDGTRPAVGRPLTGRAEVVLVGVSTGGPNALARMLPELPGDLNVPVCVVQHMPPVFTQSLAQSLDTKCAMQVKEAEDGEAAAPNRVYIAPGGRQMKVAKGTAGEMVLRVTDDPPENNCRPAADCLFRSVAHQHAGRAVAVIMTGMGTDGTLGLRLLKRGGCYSIAQDAASCVVFGMPREAIEAGVVDAVVPLDGIADEITRAVRGAGA